MATTNRLRLTRAELANFLPDQRSIRAFEKLLFLASDTIPTSLTTMEIELDELRIDADSGLAKATLALNLLSGIKSNLDALANIVAEQDSGSCCDDLESEICVPVVPTSMTLNDLYLVGTDPNPGSIGEFPAATDLVAVALTTATPADTSSVLLGPGDYEVSGTVFFNQDALTTGTVIMAGISTTSATFGGIGSYTELTAAFPANGNQIIPTPQVRIQIAPGATATVYLVAQMTFIVSTCAADGILHVRRILKG